MIKFRADTTINDLSRINFTEHCDIVYLNIVFVVCSQKIFGERIMP